MIFKKSKVLTDNIVDPVPGKSLRGFSIGNGIGLIMGILGFKDLHKGATESWSGSSSSSSSGLKTASFTDSGTLYHLTQDSPYSECDYTDQFGGKWGRDSSGFYRK